ncbi:MAG: hypothetical protein ACE363_15235 [Alphaproteobacteria bacterium]
MFLAAGIISLLIGPLLYQALRGAGVVRQTLDLLVTIIVSILALLILWDKVPEGGWITVVCAAVGFVLPLLAERLLHRQERGIHIATLAVGVAGLLLHGAADGAALLTGHHGHETTLSIAVVLHRLPAGLAVWWLVKTSFGRGPALIVLALMTLATIGGYIAASYVADLTSVQSFAWFQGFVAGSLLHLTFHRLRFADDEHGHHHH